ncbi:hypothetical protein JCM11641_007583 [Rhodosporidiobolus odoratus]
MTHPGSVPDYFSTACYVPATSSHRPSPLSAAPTQHDPLSNPTSPNSSNFQSLVHDIHFLQLGENHQRGTSDGPVTLPRHSAPAFQHSGLLTSLHHQAKVDHDTFSPATDYDTSPVYRLPPQTPPLNASSAPGSPFTFNLSHQRSPSHGALHFHSRFPSYALPSPSALASQTRETFWPASPAPIHLPRRDPSPPLSDYPASPFGFSFDSHRFAFSHQRQMTSFSEPEIVYPISQGDRDTMSIRKQLEVGKHLRSFGTVKFFDVTRGFGFIVDTHSTELIADVFVHYSGIDQQRGFRCLSQGEQVEYILTKHSSGKYQALKVTGLNGSPLVGLQDPRQAATIRRSSTSPGEENQPRRTPKVVPVPVSSPYPPHGLEPGRQSFRCQEGWGMLTL